MAAKVTVGKDACVVVGGGQAEADIAARVAQIKNMIANTEQDYEREKLNERVARLSGGVAVLQVGAQTETELKEKKLRVEDALNATKAAVEEGIVVGGGCTLVQLAGLVDSVKEDVRSCLSGSRQHPAAAVGSALGGVVSRACMCRCRHPWLILCAAPSVWCWVAAAQVECCFLCIRYACRLTLGRMIQPVGGTGLSAHAECM